MLTAEQARELTSQTVNGTLLLSHLDEIGKDIRKAAEQSKRCSYFRSLGPSSISDTVIARLRENGFEVTHHPRTGQYEPEYYTVSW